MTTGPDYVAAFLGTRASLEDVDPKALAHIAQILDAAQMTLRALRKIRGNSSPRLLPLAGREIAEHRTQLVRSLRLLQRAVGVLT